MTFAETYGDEFASIIHVHHVVALSIIGGEYEVDPIKDLRPVCPNCHAVIHSRTPPYTIEEAVKLLTRVLPP
jgi:predicted HNH restriction endonuclease